MAIFRVALLAMLPLLTLPARAQEPDSPATFQQEPTSLASSAALFLGFGPGSRHGPAMVAGFDKGTPYGLFVGRATAALETVALFPKEEPIERNLDVGLLYGWRVYILPELSVSAAAGIAATSFVKRGDFLNPGGVFQGRQYEKVRTWTWGVPLELRVQLKDDRGWGGGFVSLVCNVNDMESYGGLMVGLYFGK